MNKSHIFRQPFTHLLICTLIFYYLPNAEYTVAVDANADTLTEEAEISQRPISASMDPVSSKPGGGVAAGGL